MGYFTKREQIVILILVIIVIFIISFKIFTSQSISKIEVQEENVQKENEEIKETEKQSNDIIVHISGEVYNCGIIKVKEDSRLIDVVDKAGGLTDDADMEQINLAKKVTDEERIYIPKIGENLDNSQNMKQSNNVNDDKINLNNATKEELMSIPGIGEVTADRIIEYRSKNKFKVIEDIKNVSGIGDKKYESIKELIIVN